MNPRHPLSILGATFAIGGSAGVAFFAGACWVSPEGAAALLDLHRDGLDLKDGLAFAWLFGHAAVLLHHVLPNIARV